MDREKPFKSIDEQLAILKSRGVTISDEEEARNYLLSYNYYTVINGYKRFFLDHDKSNKTQEFYRNGTTFKHFYLVHSFDRMLRTMTVASVLQAENRMKTATIYAFCQQHKESDAYLDPANYISKAEYERTHGSGSYTSNLIRLLSVLQNLRNGKQKTEYVEHYRKKYGNVPLWVLSNCLTFGNLSAFYDLQSRSIQNSAAKYVAQSALREKVTPEQMKQCFRVLVPFRNICAHNERLFCARVGRRGDLNFADLIAALEIILSPEEHRLFVEIALNGTLHPLQQMPELHAAVTHEMGINSSLLCNP